MVSFSRRKVKVQMEDGSHKVAGMVEGAGVFVCHKHEFATESIEDFNMHLKSEEHILVQGSTGKCVICHVARVDMTGYPAGENPVCPKCEHLLLRSRERVHERLEAATKKKGEPTKK